MTRYCTVFSYAEQLLLGSCHAKSLVWCTSLFTQALHSATAAPKAGWFHFFTQIQHRTVSAPKAGLFKFKMLKTFRMELQYKDDFVTECILANISRPPEEFILKGFDFSCECLNVYQVCVYSPCSCAQNINLHKL